jgi:hypothetical protein
MISGVEPLALATVGTGSRPRDRQALVGGEKIKSTDVAYEGETLRPQQGTTRFGRRTYTSAGPRFTKRSC